ncbi:MAG: hypothetical protein JNM75_03180 [Rhodospirillales bacterium]|nr:hypothetical protein [Rhodospirillales bacterium]
MSERQDIYCAAHVLIAAFGDDAVVDAAVRAEELQTAGDRAGAALWRRILAAIGDLLDGERPQRDAKQ